MGHGIRGATQPTVEAAEARVEEEITIIEAERGAFERFVGRVEDVQVTRPGSAEPPAGPTATLAGRTGAKGGAAVAVREAYRETVMAVPHYEAEYGETIAEHMTAEFGAGLAGQILNGGALTPLVRGALVDAAREAVAERTRFFRRLRTERDSLETVREELNAVETAAFDLHGRIRGATTDEATEIDGRLATLESRCTDLADRRQELIHGRGQVSGIEGDSLLRYLYADLETVCPALADITDCLETIRHHRRRCLR
jgi:hypothetical protein